MFQLFKRKNVIISLFIGILSILISTYRLAGLIHYPPGFYKDEAAMTVNGYSILKTGKDEYGTLFPVFFRSFDDWKDPIFIYSQLPVLAITGEDIYATRLTAALWGIATIPVFSLLVWLRFKHLFYVFLGIMLLGFMPWHFHFSRIGFQLITLPFFVILYLIIADRFLKEKRIFWYYLQSAVLGLWFYTYQPARLLVIIYFLAQVFIFRKYLKPKYHVVGGMIVLLMLVPAILWNNAYPESLISRYSAITISSYNKGLLETALIYIQGYIQHYSPRFLFVEGATNIRHSPMFHYPFLWITAPLLLAGLWSLFRKRSDAFFQILIVNVLTFPVASAVTTNAPHVHRIVQLIPVAAFVMLLGWEQGSIWLTALLKKIPVSYRLVVVYSLAGLYFIGFSYEWSLFYRFYVTQYPKISELWFQVPDIQAIEGLLKYPTPHHVSLSVAEYRRSTYQLLAKTDPVVIQKGDPGVEFFDYDQLKSQQKGYYLLAYDECSAFPKRFPRAVKIEEPSSGFCIFYTN